MHIHKATYNNILGKNLIVNVFLCIITLEKINEILVNMIPFNDMMNMGNMFIVMQCVV